LDRASFLAHRYSFIIVDLHHLLLAGLPAHLCENALTMQSDGLAALMMPAPTASSPG
jgi:hypothetical protein